MTNMHSCRPRHTYLHLIPTTSVVVVVLTTSGIGNTRLASSIGLLRDDDPAGCATTVDGGTSVEADAETPELVLRY